MNQSRRVLFGALLSLHFFFCGAHATSRAADALRGEADRNPASLGHVECITPDGQVSIVSPRCENAAVKVARNAIICMLSEGHTTFIIAIPKVGVVDQLTFVNENAAACGELAISVSNSRAAADSPAWTAVDGAIPFAHKRLFNLSLLGIEARYVKLSFRVQSTTKAAILAAPVVATIK
jgi:hypothetical protein